MDTSLQSLVERWHDRAVVLRSYSAIAQAEVLAKCAQELQEALREHWLEALTLEESAAESGYSYSALQKKVAGGEIENAGSRGSPRIRRGDLPRKARQKPDVGLADQIIARRTHQTLEV